MIALPGLPILPRLSVTQWLLAGALAIIAALLVWIYGLRIDLPIIGEIGPKGLLAEKAELAKANKKFLAQRDAARAESARIAKANIAATEKANADEKADRAVQGDAAERFIAAGGVRRCPTPRAYPAAPGQSAGIDAGAGTLPVVDDLPEVVTVLPEDVRICTDNTVHARAWREWGLAIEANSKLRSEIEDVMQQPRKR